MENTLQTYLPQNLPDEKFTILSKYNSINNLSYLSTTSHTASFDKLQEIYINLPTEDQSYYIVTDKFAQQLAAQLSGQPTSTNVSQEEIAQIINKTQNLLSITREPLLTEVEVEEKRKQEEDLLAKKLGLTKTVDQYFVQFIPDVGDPDSTFSVIGKRKNNTNLNEMTIIDDEFFLSFNFANKISSILDKQNNGDWEYYVVSSKLSRQLTSLPSSTIFEAVNKTQGLLGSNKEMAVLPVTPSIKISEKKVTPPKLTDILENSVPSHTPEKEEPRTTVPTPENIQNNYRPLADTLKMFSDEKLQAKLKKSPISKTLVITSMGLLGLSIMSMAVSPITLPLALVVGVIALIKHKYFRGDKSEIKNWDKREKFLKQAALEQVGGDYNGNLDIKGVERIAFTPEIVNKYKELCKKANISAISLSVEQLRDNGNPTHVNLNKSRIR